jgi:hypothetical protein
MDNDERGWLDGSNGDLAEYPVEYLDHVALHEFRKARIKAMLRRLVPGYGLVGESTSDWRGASSPSRSIPMASIAGILTDGRFLPLPILPRRLEEIWMRSFYRLDEDDYRPLGAVKRGEFWFLEDEPGALLGFEILRSRGVSSLRVRAARLPVANEDFSLLSIPSLASVSGAVLGSRPAK